jgi:hypothetical protein
MRFQLKDFYDNEFEQTNIPFTIYVVSSRGTEDTTTESCFIYDRSLRWLKHIYEMRIGLNLIEQKSTIGKIQCHSKILLII